MKKINTIKKLNIAEKKRYSRHFVLPSFGVEGQEKLKNSSCLVVGAGGLGSPILLYLAAAGVGRIGIVEFDTVDETNLQRQVLYTTQDIGKSKALCAKEKILALNPYIEVEVFESPLTAANALEIVAQFDVVADGTDNFATRYLVNDACVLCQKTNVYASIFRFEGQIAVFNALLPDGTRSCNYRDLFPSPPPPNLVPNCAEGGVLGVLPGIVGCMQANEVIKILSGVGTPLINKLMLYDASEGMSRMLKINKNNQIKIEHLIDYEEFCGIKKTNIVPEISVEEFLKLMAQNTDFQLIDVRESYEYELDNLNGLLIPLSSLEHEIDKISQTKQVIVHCKSGARSAKAVELLNNKFHLKNIFSLKGGIEAVRMVMND